MAVQRETQVREVVVCLVTARPAGQENEHEYPFTARLGEPHDTPTIRDALMHRPQTAVGTVEADTGVDVPDVQRDVRQARSHG